MLLRRPLLLAAVFLAAATTTRAEIEFVGVLVMPGRSLFALSNDPAKPAVWRTLGQDFTGHMLRDFDGKTNTLTLVKDGVELRLRLKDEAKNQAGRFEFTGTITFAHGEKVEVRRVTLALDETTVFPLTDGITCSITPRSRVPPIYAREGKTISYLVILSKSGDNGWFKRSAIAARPNEPLDLKIDDHDLPLAPTSN